MVEFKNLEGIKVNSDKSDEKYDLGNAKKILVNGEKQKYVSKDIIDGLNLNSLTASVGPKSGKGSVVLVGYNDSDEIEFFF
jgi:hypothetical protein